MLSRAHLFPKQSRLSMAGKRSSGASSAAGEKAAGRGEAPTPGLPARGSERGLPIMALLDLLGRRWALRVIWELRETPLSFRALQERCDGMSSSVLGQRLRELRAADVVEVGDEGYRLTAEGRRLLDAYKPLGAWAERWAQRTRRS
jgi:DNA-binding HxlR family transcriptional regulator